MPAYSGPGITQLRPSLEEGDARARGQLVVDVVADAERQVDLLGLEADDLLRRRSHGRRSSSSRGAASSSSSPS